MSRPPLKDSVLLNTVKTVATHGRDKAQDLLNLSESQIYIHLKKAAERGIAIKSKKKGKGEPKIVKTSVSVDANELSIIKQLRETGTLPNASVLKSDISINNMAAENINLKRQYKSTLEELHLAQSKLDLALDIQDVKPRDFAYSVKARNKDSESTAFMIASDWHIEERVDPAVVNHLNEYNPTIAKQRANKFFTNGLKLIEIQRHGTKIEELVLAVIGDIITGYIHDELMENNYMSPAVAISTAYDILFSGIEFLVREGKFKKITIICSPGNHGRTTDKKHISTSADNSYEWLMYEFMKKHYKDHPVVNLIVDKSYHTYLNVYDNFVVRFHHGDALKFGGGVGGITIPTKKAISQWNKSRKANLDVFGHFHQFMDGGDFICNGSLIGWNAYAIEIKAEFEQAKQAFFLIEKEMGKTIVAPIRVL